VRAARTEGQTYRRADGYDEGHVRFPPPCKTAFKNFATASVALNAVGSKPCGILSNTP